jgi:uncharacterized membrane protein YgaE (UPF0421/DUF939 family)
LTDTLEKLRLKNLPNPKKKEPSNPADVHIKEMENANSQIEMFKKEIRFLKERQQEGGQLETIKVLGLECVRLTEEEAELIKRLKTLNTKTKAIGNRMKKLTENKDHDNKVGFS